jgi:hypothetical protein
MWRPSRATTPHLARVNNFTKIINNYNIYPTTNKVYLKIFSFEKIIHKKGGPQFFSKYPILRGSGKNT